MRSGLGADFGLISEGEGSFTRGVVNSTADFIREILFPTARLRCTVSYIASIYYAPEPLAWIDVHRISSAQILIVCPLTRVCEHAILIHRNFLVAHCFGMQRFSLTNMQERQRPARFPEHVGQWFPLLPRAPAVTDRARLLRAPKLFSPLLGFRAFLHAKIAFSKTARSGALRHYSSTRVDLLRGGS